MNTLQPSYFQINSYKNFDFTRICWHSILATFFILLALFLIIVNYRAILNMGVYNQLTICLLAALVVIVHGLSKYVYKNMK
jgi:hypothetical protein